MTCLTDKHQTRARAGRLPFMQSVTCRVIVRCATGERMEDGAT